MQPLSDAVPATLASLLERQPLSPAKVAFAWRVAVGPALARATEVALDPGGTLVVTASDRHWTREIDAAKSVVHARLSRLLGPDVVRVIVVRGSWSPRRQATRARRPRRSTA